MTPAKRPRKTVARGRSDLEAAGAMAADLLGDPTSDEMRRLGAHLRSAASASKQRRSLIGKAAIGPGGFATLVSDQLPEILREVAQEPDLEQPVQLATLIARRDDQLSALSGAFRDELSGILPAERLGPFRTHGGIDAWFDVFLAARQIVVTAAGSAAPALIFTSARPPVRKLGRTTIDIEEGTVWIRGDLLTGGLPAGAYAGVKVTDGSLRTTALITGSGDQLTLPGPLDAELRLELASDVAAAQPGGCDGAKTSLTLPDAITLTFSGAGVATVGDPGGGTAWGQAFAFDPSLGSWTFCRQLWILVLDYTIGPTQFDPAPIGHDLITFGDAGAITGGGLSLPLVVTSQPQILGEAARSADWMLRLAGLSARWYEPDPRTHALPDAWLEIASSGVVLATEAVEPLVPAVSHAYELWTIAGGTKRLPWRAAYRAPFGLVYRCHVADGEQLLVTGQADVVLDRPVTTNGVPVTTPTTQAAILLRRFGGVTSALLAALGGPPAVASRFALENALVWSTNPLLLTVQGVLDEAQVNAGSAELILGVYGWVPTLPDPYVSSAVIAGPKELGRRPRSLLTARVTWAEPDAAMLAFEGSLAGSPELGGRRASDGEPRPARRSDGSVGVGLTQVAQDRRTFTRSMAREVRSAQAAELERRGRRSEIARQNDRKRLEAVDAALVEFLGAEPGFLLLDVSTNQDLLGVALVSGRESPGVAVVGPAVGGLPVNGLAVEAPVGGMRVVALPQVQWEPVRTLDSDQDIATMGWFPTPLASSTDGGATQIGTRSQRLMPVTPDAALEGTLDAHRGGTPVAIRTTFPFGLIAGIVLQPTDTADRKADLYGLTRPDFPAERSLGGIQITAHAEGGRPDDGGISPTFVGRMHQLLNGVDLTSGVPLGVSVLGETLQPAGSVERIFNDDMAARPRVPVTRIDLSGYGGSNFSDWNNPFAAFAEAAKVQFELIVGRTALEIVKINSVLHPWGIRVTRSVTIERRPGGGVIRRDSGWQAFTPGLFDYRYFDTAANDIVVAPYQFDAGVFRGLFNVRRIRPATGAVFNHGSATLVPYYFDADVAFEGLTGRAPASGILGWLQTSPNGVPASADDLRELVATQGPVGGPLDVWLDFGGSGLPFRAQRIEVGLADDSGTPLFVATARGAPKLPETGAWSVVVRPVTGAQPADTAATTVAENRGVPYVRRYPVAYPAGDATVFGEPPLAGAAGAYRFADAGDLLTPSNPSNDYGLLQSTPTHAFLFPRPSVTATGTPRIDTGHRPALADIFARSTSKGAFPPVPNTIELTTGSWSLDVATGGALALSSIVTVVGHPTPLQLAGTPGHGSRLFYDGATLRFELDHDRWEAEFSGLRVWSDIAGLERLTGAAMRVVGSTEQRPQIAEFESLLLQKIDDILQYIPIFGQRGVQGPIDLAATNAKHEVKVEAELHYSVPAKNVLFTPAAGIQLELSVKQSAGIDVATTLPKAAVTFGAELEGKVGTVPFLIVTGEVSFELTTVGGTVTEEKLELMAFVGVGVRGEIGGFEAYAFLGAGFVLEWEVSAGVVKYGGIVALEASVDLKVVEVTIRAELKGLVYDDAGTTKCDYSGSVELEVEIGFFFSISASYEISDTTDF